MYNDNVWCYTYGIHGKGKPVWLLSSCLPPPQNVNDMAAMERPDWQAVMAYITNIYKHFEVDNKM